MSPHTYQSLSRPRLPRYKVGDEVAWRRVEDFRGHTLPRPIALINGAFDILHPGHMRLIRAASYNARTVVCALDSDDKVSISKGPGRPILSFPARAAMFNYLPVDYIVEIESDSDFLHLCSTLQPDFRVLGAEYKGRRHRVPIPVLYVPTLGHHTSDIVKLIKEAI